VIVSGAVSFLGYVLGVARLSAVLSGGTQMAVNTALLMILVGMALLFCQPDVGFMRYFVSKSAGGIILRRFVPAVVVVTFGVGLIGEYVITPLTDNVGFARQISIALLMIAGVSLVFVIGRHLDHVDTERSLLAERNRLLKRVEVTAEELRRSNQTLQDFAFIAAHDLRAPLRKVAIFSDRLADRHAGGLDERGQDDVRRIQMANRRMQALLDSLLTLTHVSANDAQSFEQVDLGRVVGQVVADLDEEIGDTGATVDVGPLPTIDADAAQIQLLIANLMANALKYRRQDVDPAVTISATIGPDPGNDDVELCQLVVRDNGIGFESQHEDEVFGLFSRLHGVSEYDGSGIGLAICRRVAEIHSGTITASSRPGVGSAFTLTVPTVQ
jgi:signal transduction histidine kinase